MSATTAEEPRLALPLSAGAIATLLFISTALFLVFPSPLWRAGRTDSHLLRFAFSYFSIVPLAMAALRLRRALRFASLVTVVALVWGAKLVVTAVLYQVVGPSRRADLHAPDPSDRARVSATSSASAPDASIAVALLTGRIVDRERAAPNVIVSVCNAAPSDEAGPVDRGMTIASGALSPKVVDASLGDRLTIRTSDAAPHMVRGLALGLPALSLAVVPARASPVELSTLGTIALEVDGRAAGLILVFDHSLHASTDRDGRFRIQGVPVGLRALCIFTGATPAPRIVNALVDGVSETTFDIGPAS